MSNSMQSKSSLEEWRTEYQSLNATYGGFNDSHRVLLDVNSDSIDIAGIEDQISKAARRTDVSDGLCVACRQLFNNWPDLGKKHWAHTVGRPCHTTEIEAAARQGCKFCSFLLSRLRDTKSLDTFRKIEKRFQQLGDASTASLSVSNWAWDNSGQMSQLLWINFPGKVTTSCNSWCANQTKFESHVVPPCSYSQSPTNVLEIANKWLRACSSSHERCSTEPNLERPTRLLSVANDAVRLVETAAWDRMPHYATLSYCWGDADFFKLRQDSVDILFQGIAVDRLPQTFRDAIYITRKLGLEYLWIDALCIVQEEDDSRDWRREAGLMRSVYGGSHVNIAAADCKNVHESLFTTVGGHCGGLLARIQTQNVGRVQSFHTSEVYHEATSGIHLATRAWALQEKLLAPRTIYFGTRGMFWECRSMIASEYLPSGFPGKLGSHMVRPTNKSFDWRRVVSHYSAASLTHPSDKLPALSGVARRQYEVTGDTYLAGMWKHLLVKQLGWLSHSEVELPRPDWRAPNWSWTSVDGLVYLWSYWSAEAGDPANTFYAEVVNVSTRTAGQDPFGAVEDAELQLACTAIVSGYYQKAEESETADTNSTRPHRVVIGQNGYHLPVKMDSCLNGIVKPEQEIYLLPLFGGESGMGRAGEEELLLRGMVLKRCENVKDSFRRIGGFDVRFRPWENSDEDAEAYRRVVRAMEEVGPSTAESLCSSIATSVELSKAKYIISID